MKRAAPIVLANWGRRFIAWVLDYLLINVLLAYFQLEEIETAILPEALLRKLPSTNLSLWSPLSVLTFFIYWTLCEWYFGRSIGQLLVNVRLTDLRGNPVSLTSSTIQSVGKSLLLPIDCLLGWAYRPCRERRQRFFNMLSGTLIVYVGHPQRTKKGKHYDQE